MYHSPFAASVPHPGDPCGASLGRCALARSAGALCLLLVCVMAVMLAAVTPAISGSDLGEAWRAYGAAVKRHAPPDELLPLAQDVYDALPARPEAPKQIRTKAAAAFNLAKALEGTHSLREARTRLRESIRLFEQASGKDSLDLVDPLWELAVVESVLKDNQRIFQRLFLQLDRLLEKAGPPYAMTRIELRVDAARHLIRYGADDLAGEHLTWLEEHADLAGRQRPIVLASVALQRGLLDLGLRHYRSAARRLKRAHELFTKRFSPSDQRSLKAASYLVTALEELGRSEEATAYCQEIGRYQPPGGTMDYLPIYRTTPIYPSAAAQRGTQGYVVVSLTVTKEGRVADIKVIEGNPPGAFERAAIAAARRFRYAPRFHDGKPVDTPDVRYIFTFRLQD
ncbi:MAG: TonB family protein [Alphaproteobacteria bacterium]|nr:MAG: TonB family protein [Alphaproteobacteria bacterium]